MPLKKSSTPPESEQSKKSSRVDYFGRPLEVGSLVILRSGGPLMTVAGFTPERVCVTWFPLNASDASLVGAGLQSSFFPPKTLVLQPTKQPD